jgi:hypothetical protein
MSEKFGFPKNRGISTAGITIHLDPSPEDRAEPFDITLYLKKPREGKDLPDEENSLTTTGKLIFRFGKKGSVELFAENIGRIDGSLDEQGDEL